MGINILTKMFREQIERDINQSGIPPAVMRVVLEEALSDVIAREESAIKNEFDLEGGSL